MADFEAGREAISIFVRERAVYEAARRRSPQRWAGPCKSFARIASVDLNPRKASAKEAVA